MLGVGFYTGSLLERKYEKVNDMKKVFLVIVGIMLISLVVANLEGCAKCKKKINYLLGDRRVELNVKNSHGTYTPIFLKANADVVVISESPDMNSYPCESSPTIEPCMADGIKLPESTDMPDVEAASGFTGTTIIPELPLLLLFFLPIIRTPSSSCSLLYHQQGNFQGRLRLASSRTPTISWPLPFQDTCCRQQVYQTS